ncbi:MAG: ComEA family DNA-binding protein [Actinomycetota bacterium]|nr:ComEA family DNA-binding protein [Actinomycetota bacterium]
MLDRFSAFLDRLIKLPYWQLALLALLLAAGAILGYILLRPPLRPDSQFHAVEEATLEEPRELTVHVAGAVSQPGVYRLEEGDRVVDAVEEAGGPLPEADLDGLNLAQEVQDGQKVVIPQRGEPDGEATKDESSDRVCLNGASQDELEELPGIGPKLAGRIIAYREKNGGFRNVEELKQVAGIGDKKLAELRDLVQI